MIRYSAKGKAAYEEDGCLANWVADAENPETARAIAVALNYGLPMLQETLGFKRVATGGSVNYPPSSVKVREE